MKNNWEIPVTNEDIARELSCAGVPPLAAKTLASRDFRCAAEALDFLDTDIRRLCDPLLLPDAAEAVSRIERAIAGGERIAVYGDYDVDGITAVCVMIKCLRLRGADCSYYIPNRFEEGYGLNIEALRRLKDEGVTLVITVDSGITAINEALWASDNGIDLIITDHHECMETLPCAPAVLNPRRADSIYPFKMLAGVGVAFKLACLLSKEQGIEEIMARYAYLAAIGTIADVMPVTGENRIIAAYGLRNMRTADSVGLNMLIESVAPGGKDIVSDLIGFGIAPRINAAGRLCRSDAAVELFLTADAGEARELSELLCGLNEQRRDLERQIFIQVQERLDSECICGEYRDDVIVLYGDGWHQGVIGIVASRTAEQYRRPAFLICLEGDTGKASARSYNGFNIYSALEYCAELLDTYGGHELAAGFTIKRENIEAFKARLREFARLDIQEDRAKCYKVDCEVKMDELSTEAVEGLAVLEPHGTMNPQPVFLLKNVVASEISGIGSGKHLRIRLADGGLSVNCVFFSMDSGRLGVIEGDLCDVLFAPKINVYRNTRTVQLVIQDMRPSEAFTELEASELEIYGRYKNGEDISRDEAMRLIPAKPEILSLWRHLKRNAVNYVISENLGCLCRRAARSAGLEYTALKTLVCLDIFAEYSLISYTAEHGQVNINMNRTGGIKVDLSGSRILSELRGRGAEI